MCDRGGTGGTNSRCAAEAHHTLFPSWTSVRVFARAGRPVMRSGIPAPPHLPYPASGALHARASVSTAPAGRGRASVCALPDLTHLPAPAAWGRWATPPTKNRRRLGSAIATATLFELPAISVRLPPAVRRPCGQGAAYWAAAGRLAPLCHCASLRCRAAPNSATLLAQRGCAPSACQNSRPVQTAYGRQPGARWPLATCGLVTKP